MVVVKEFAATPHFVSKGEIMAKKKEVTVITMEEKMELMLNNKAFDFKRGDDESLVVEKVPIGIPNLDALIGGGFPKKALTELVGDTGAGKSYLATQIAKAVIEADPNATAALVDTERAVNPDWLKRCGVPVEKIAILQPTSGEEAIDATRMLLQSGIDIVILDSLAGLMPKDNLENDSTYTPMAWQARFINQNLPKLVNDLRHGSMLIIVNQLRDTLGGNKYEVNLNVPGGQAQVFFAHNFIELRKGAWIKDKEDVRIGFEMNIRLRKGRFSKEQWNSTKVPFKVDGGIDLIETFMREGLAQGRILQSGAWYTYGDERVMGSQGLHNLFDRNPDLYSKLKLEIGEI